WRYDDVMHLDPYIERVQDDLRAAASLGNPELAHAVDHLARTLDASLRLSLIDAVGAAADELGAELAPDAVTVQLEDGAPRLVVHREEPGAPAPLPATSVPEPMDDDDQAELARVSLRIGAALKRQVEAAAAAEHVSVNTWITRALATALQADPHPASRITRRGQLRGWAL
ncbi:MAG: histidine kinase, partial [Thermoleophilia bacterium]|nr:histidine kinase [Thermoleophilia bacterium]